MAKSDFTANDGDLTPNREASTTTDFILQRDFGYYNETLRLRYFEPVCLS